MATMYLYERKNGEDYEEYSKTFDVGELDKSNCVMIQMIDDNGDEYLIQVPIKMFSKFVIQCQKMKAVLS